MGHRSGKDIMSVVWPYLWLGDMQGGPGGRDGHWHAPPTFTLWQHFLGQAPSIPAGTSLQLPVGQEKDWPRWFPRVFPALKNIALWMAIFAM